MSISTGVPVLVLAHVLVLFRLVTRSSILGVILPSATPRLVCWEEDHLL